MDTVEALTVWWRFVCVGVTSKSAVSLWLIAPVSLLNIKNKCMHWRKAIPLFETGSQLLGSFQYVWSLRFCTAKCCLHNYREEPFVRQSEDRGVELLTWEPGPISNLQPGTQVYTFLATDVIAQKTVFFLWASLVILVVKVSKGWRNREPFRICEQCLVR